MEAPSSDYTAFSYRQQREAEAMLGEFLATISAEARKAFLNPDALTPEQRNRLAGAVDKASFKEFLDSLSDDRRRRFLSGEPKAAGDIGLEGDVAESPAAAETLDLAEALDTLADELAEQFRLEERMAADVALFAQEYIREQSERYSDWLLTKVIIYLCQAENCKIAAVATAFALSVPLVWVPESGNWKVGDEAPENNLHSSQISAARALGCSRQNLCKAVRRAAEFYQIEEGMHLKSPEAIAAFSISQAKAHWRRRMYGE